MTLLILILETVQIYILTKFQKARAKCDLWSFQKVAHWFELMLYFWSQCNPVSNISERSSCQTFFVNFIILSQKIWPMESLMRLPVNRTGDLIFDTTLSSFELQTQLPITKFHDWEKDVASTRFFKCKCKKTMAKNNSLSWANNSLSQAICVWES